MAPRAPADRFLFHAFLALLLWIPLPFGSNVAWASSFMEAWVFLIAGLWLVQYYRGKVSLSRPFVRAWPVTACLLAALLWILVQALPLPAGALGLLSPRALAIHSSTHSYPSLSLDVHATRQAALQTLAYLPARLARQCAPGVADPAWQQGAREARARGHGHGPRAHALAYGQHGVLRKPHGRRLFLPAGRAQALRPHHHLLRQPAHHRSARRRQFLRPRESGGAHPADFH